MLYEHWRPSEIISIEGTDNVRGDLSIKTIRAAINSGLRVVVTDGGSSKEFLAALSEFQEQGLTLLGGAPRGLAPQRRSSFEYASALEGVEAIVYTQPEKVGLVANCLPQITYPIIYDKADIVIPGRDPELFKKTYPPYMYKSEIKVNGIYNRVLQARGHLREDLDWFFGPVVFRNDPKVVSLFLERYEFDTSGMGTFEGIDPERRSNTHYFPIVKALYNGFKVVPVNNLPFSYPDTQRQNELALEAIFSERRRHDRFNYLYEFYHFVRYLEGNPKSRIRPVT